MKVLYSVMKHYPKVELNVHKLYTSSVESLKHLKSNDMIQQLSFLFPPPVVKTDANKYFLL